RREPLETKRQRAQALAEQLLASAQDLGAKLAVERNVSITTQDIARYMIGLDGTDHVRAALEGKSVTLPSPLAPESVTPNVTILQLRCSFCRKHSGEVRHLTVVRTIAVCSECLARYEIESRLDQCIEHLKAIL